MNIMKRMRRLFPLVPLCIVAVVGFGACGQDGPYGTPTPTPTADATAVPIDRVKMQNAQFIHARIQVRAGATVKWTNVDMFDHTVTPTNKTQWGSMGSGDDPLQWIKNGESWSFTFREPGVYKYYCIAHTFKDDKGEWRGMIGEVIVNP